MSNSPPHLRHMSAPSGISLSPGTTPPLSRTNSSVVRTIRLSDKTVHVIRNPAEAYTLKDVDWVIEGSEKHVIPCLSSIDLVGVSATIGRNIGPQEIRLTQ